MHRRECPVCRNPIGETDPSCATCGLRLEGPLAEDLLRIHAEFLDTEAALRDLDERRLELEKHRDSLIRRGSLIVARLRGEQEHGWAAAPVPAAAPAAAAVPLQPTPAAPPQPTSAPAAPAVPYPPEPAERGPRRDLSGFAVQNLLLLLGGLLLGIAAIVFTVVSWGHLSIRAAILATATVGTLAFPWPLVRRRLQSTAETIAYIGLVFIPLTGLAVVNAASGQSNAPEELSVPGSGNSGWWVAAGASAAVAVLWAGYARVAPLRLPAPTAVAIAQVPLPLAAVAAGPTPTGVALALVATAGLDLLIWLRDGSASERAVASAAGIMAGVGGAGTALAASFMASSPADGVRASGVLVLAALLCAAGAWLLKDHVERGLTSGLSATCLVAAFAAPAAEALSSGWAVAPYTASACLVLAGTRRAPERLRLGATLASLGALALTVLLAVPDVLLSAIVPFTRAVDASFWNQDGPDGTLGLDQPGIGYEAAPLILGAAAIVVLLLPRLLTRPVPDAATRPAGLALATAAVLVLPAAAESPYAVSLAVVLALTLALLALTTWVKSRSLVIASTSLGAYLAVLAFMWAAQDETASVVTASVIMAAFLAYAFPARTAVAQSAMAAGTVLGTTAFLVVLWAVLGWDTESLVAAWLGVRLVAMLVALPTGGPPGVLARAVVGSRRTLRTIVLGGAFSALRVVPPGAALRARRPAQAIALDISSAVITTVLIVVLLSDAGSGDPERLTVLSLVLAVTAVMAAVSAWSLKRVGLPSAFSLGESYVFAALAPLPLSESFFPALFGPYGWVVAGAWEGAPESARAALGPDTTWTVQPALLPVLLIAGVAAVSAAAVDKGRWAALGVAQVVIPVAVAPIPLAANLPYWAALVFLVALTTALALWAAMNRTAAGGAALWTATLAVSWSLADRTATLAVLAALAIACVVCALRGGRSPVASVASGVATLALGAEGAAAALAGDLPARHAALVVLAIAVLAVRAGALLDREPARDTTPDGDGSAGTPDETRHPRRLPRFSYALDIAALLLWCAALAMTSAHVEQMTLVMSVGALTAVMAAGGPRIASARPPVLASAWIVQGLALLMWLDALGEAALTPYTWVPETWSRQADPDLTAIPLAAAVVGGITALMAIASARVLDGPRGAYRAAVIGVPLALLVLPATAGLPYWAGLALVCGLVTALAIRATLARTADAAAAVMAFGLATLALAWSSPLEPATLAVTGGLAVLAAGCALLARDTVMRCGSSAVAVLASGGLVAAACLAAGLSVGAAGLAVLAVAAPAALGAWEIGHRRPEAGVSVELAGYAVAVAGLAMCFVSVLYATIALTCAGVLALAIAIRPDRRQALVAAAVLLHLALWLRLADAGVAAPEAYTVSVSVLGLLGGWWLRQRDHALSSWAAYAPALALTLLPSLAVAWSDDGLTRPLLLGLAAFACTFAGAWTRLQAPLLLGGTVLVVNAAHELYPALADLVGNGPRWLPIALTGAALLFMGATYEHRLRDLRRVRASIAKMG